MKHWLWDVGEGSALCGITGSREQTIVVSVRAELSVLDEWEMGTFLTAIGRQCDSVLPFG